MATANEKGALESNLKETLQSTVEFIVYEDAIKGRNTLVYKGLFNKSIPIALKRYQKEDFEKNGYKAERDFQFLSSAKNRHPNIIRFFGKVDSKCQQGTIQFSYLATELCECSVADIIDPKRREDAKSIGKTEFLESILLNLPLKEIIRQSMEAVRFLHSINRIHRNLHPDNFLIFCVDNQTDYFLVKLTDFQHSKDLEASPKDSGTLGKLGWVAPEILINNDKIVKLLDDRKHRNVPESQFEELKSTKMTDAFIMGCYCYYVLTEGYHPFGKSVTDQWFRILHKEKHEIYNPLWNGGWEWHSSAQKCYGIEEAKWALSMIKDLIQYEPTQRKELGEVLEGRFFHPDSYEIYGSTTSPKPGLCIIITQRKSYDPLKDAADWESYCGEMKFKGIGLDEERLQERFSSFGYDILPFRNLTADEIRDNLKPDKLIKKIGVTSFAEYASLVICYLGHGDKGVVCGADNKTVSLNSITYDAFNDKVCPDLKGKPKVVIVLACQGNRKQKTYVYKGMSASSSSSATCHFLSSSSNITNNEEENITPPVSHFIRLMSTIEDYVTSYDKKEGSPFIQSLCDALDYEYGKEDTPNLRSRKRDLTQLFTMFITPSVGRTFQTPEFRSSLSKVIRFQKAAIPGTIFDLYDGARGKKFQDERQKYE